MLSTIVRRPSYFFISRKHPFEIIKCLLKYNEVHTVYKAVSCYLRKTAEQQGATLIEQSFILLDYTCDSVMFCAFFPLSPVCFRFTIRPLAPKLSTGPCKPNCCQVTFSHETNPSCQCPASTTYTPELGHAFHSGPGHTGPRVSTDCCAEVQED